MWQHEKWGKVYFIYIDRYLFKMLIKLLVFSLINNIKSENIDNIRKGSLKKEINRNAKRHWSDTNHFSLALAKIRNQNGLENKTKWLDHQETLGFYTQSQLLTVITWGPYQRHTCIIDKKTWHKFTVDNKGGKRLIKWKRGSLVHNKKVNLTLDFTLSNN